MRPLESYYAHAAVETYLHKCWTPTGAVSPTVTCHAQLVILIDSGRKEDLTTCRGCMSGHRQQESVWTSVRGSGVSLGSPAKRGPKRLDAGEHTRTLSKSPLARSALSFNTATPTPASDRIPTPRFGRRASISPSGRRQERQARDPRLIRIVAGRSDPQAAMAGNAQGLNFDAPGPRRYGRLQQAGFLYRVTNSAHPSMRPRRFSNRSERA